MAASSILSQFKFTARQRQAATRHSPAIAVTAGAGSGKTRVLVGRYLHLLEKGYPLRSLVAITFTDKAAREMRARIRAAIEERLAESPISNLQSPREASNLESPTSNPWQTAFTELDAARIGTIHSLCADILRAHPAEAAIDPNFAVLEEGPAAALQAQAVEAALAWVVTQPDPARLVGLFTENGLRATISTLLNRRLDVEPLRVWARAAAPHAEAAIGDWLDAKLSAPAWIDSLAALSDVHAHDPSTTLRAGAEDKLEVARRAVLAHQDEVLTARTASDWDAVFMHLAQLRGAISTAGQKANWDAGDLASARQAMSTLRTHYDAELAPLVGKDALARIRWSLDRQVAEALPSLRRVFARACEEYQRLKDERQALDFDDLEGRAAQLLTDHADVRDRWRRDIRAVLVDEFQDTNDRQRQIVYALTGFRSTTGDSATELFVVGDAKQCLAPGTLVLTPAGYRPIEQIAPGDEVMAASGRGQTGAFAVEHVYKRHCSGAVITIITAKGIEIRCTPEHALFTRLIPDPNAYYVYVMRHSAKGYRIGMTRGYRTGERRITNGLDSRCRQEGGEAILVERFALTADKRWVQTPAGQVFPGMQVPVVDNGHVVVDEVIQVTRELFDGPVYDLTVSRVRNYIANGVVVHNSIYRFRGADVAVFRQVQSDIETSDGLTVDLDLTFRAHQPLVEIANALLAPILGESDDPERPYRVPFSRLRAHRRAPESDAIHEPYVEFHIGLGDAKTGRAAAAAALADRLRRLHGEEGVDWGQVALLFRASTAFGVYEDALERAGIPFITVAGRGFYDRPEVRDLLNALAAIADPTDDLALAGLLRSPAVGLSDAELYRLRFSGDDRPRPLWEALVETSEVSQDFGSLTRARAHNIIAELHALSGRVSVAEILKRFLDLTGYRATLRVSAVPEGNRLRRNVDKLLIDAHRSRLVSLGEFLEYAQTLQDIGVREGEAPVEAGGATQLMTVHKAKGLEFPVVVIADAAYEVRGAADTVLIDDGLGLLIGLSDADGARPVAWRLAGLKEAAKDDAEDRRLLYVAATRAREKLIVSGHARRTTKGALSLSGWLERLGDVIGLSDVTLEGEVSVPRALDVRCPGDAGPIACVLHPPRALEPTRVSEAPSITSEPTPLTIPDLVPPVLPVVLDKPVDGVGDPSAPLRANLSLTQEQLYNPQSRVWRVVPRAKRPSGPAWVVGKLAHAALRRWRFPNEDNFDVFLWPLALETGLTDAAEIQATISEARRLLARFRSHPLYVEIAAAERYHEVPYALPDDTGVIDLLYRADGGWTIVDFKTDELRSEAEMRETIQREGYDTQVRRYADAVTALFGQRPRTLLAFLRVAGEARVMELDKM